MKPAVHYASKNTVFVEMLHREKLVLCVNDAEPNILYIQF